MNQISDAIKRRLSANPGERTFEFELEGFGIELSNENDYLDMINTLNGLKNKAGIEYEISKFDVDRFGRKQPITLYDSYKCKIVIKDKKKFDNFYKQNERPDSEDEVSDGIYYNPDTGIGYAYGKRFKFKNDQPDFIIFSKMYENINKPVPRTEVLEVIGYEETAVRDRLTAGSKQKTSSQVMATYKINEVAKKMRSMTGLNTDQIVNNNGDLTLVGERLPSPPK